MISIENYKTRFPNNNEKYFNELNEQEKVEYLELYQKYYKLILKYFIKKFKLAEYDKSLKDNEDKFVMVKKENMDIYQYLSSDDLNYFYLRNNFYIEHLTQGERNYLKKLNVNGIEDAFIIKTLKRVITEIPDAQDKKISLCFGGDSLEFYKLNGSIIFGVRYDEFTDKIPNDENWLSAYAKIKDELNFILDGFKYANKSLNDMPIEVINYNDYTVVKMSHSENDAEDIKKLNIDNNVQVESTKIEEPKGSQNNIVFY